MNTAFAWLMGLLDVVGSQPLGGRVRQCTAHHDPTPSLSISPGRGGAALVNCFAGCETDAVLAALRCSRIRLAKPAPVLPAEYARMVGLKLEFPPVKQRAGHPASRGYRLEAVHDYGQHLLLRWRRADHKELLWETKAPGGGTVPGLMGTPLSALPLYREREVRMATAVSEPVLVVESESSVEALRGWYATTWAGGAPAVNLGRLHEVLGGYPYTVVIPDNDDAGRRCLARMTAVGLAPHVLMPADGQDARDLLRDLGPARFADLVTRQVHGRRAGWRAA